MLCAFSKREFSLGSHLYEILVVFVHFALKNCPVDMDREYLVYFSIIVINSNTSHKSDDNEMNSALLVIREISVCKELRQ